MDARTVGIGLLLLLPLALIVNIATGLNTGVRISDLDVNFGLQILYETPERHYATITRSQSFGSVDYKTLDWTAPDGNKATHFRFITTVTIVGSDYPPYTEYRVYAKVTMDKIAHRNNQPDFSYGQRVRERSDIRGTADSQGKINRKIYLITSYEYPDVGDFGDSNLNTADNLYWTWFVSPPPEIDEKGETLEYVAKWEVRVSCQNVEKVRTGNTNIRFTYQPTSTTTSSPTPTPTTTARTTTTSKTTTTTPIQTNPYFDVTITTGQKWSLSTLSLLSTNGANLQIFNKSVDIHWAYVLTTMVGAFLVLVGELHTTRFKPK